MNEIEFMIGDMLNDEKRRIIYIPLVDLSKITDPELLIISQVAMENKEFTFLDLFKRFGKDVAVKAMDLANKAAIMKLTQQGKL